MNLFGIDDERHLRAAEGWLGLGNPAEAKLELDNLAPELQKHPDVLELRWEISFKESNWDACRDFARALTEVAPERPGGWIHLAYAARRAAGGSVQAAWDILQPAAEKFPEEVIIAFNLACYACQLGNLSEARKWLEKAFEIGDDENKLKQMVLEEPDLKALQSEIKES